MTLWQALAQYITEYIDDRSQLSMPCRESASVLITTRFRATGTSRATLAAPLCVWSPHLLSSFARSARGVFVRLGQFIRRLNVCVSQRHVLGVEDKAHLAEDANLVAARLAREVADAAGRKIWVAGSMSTHPPRALAVLQSIRAGEKIRNTNTSEVCVCPPRRKRKGIT